MTTPTRYYFFNAGVYLVVVMAFMLVNRPIVLDIATHSFDDGTYSHAYLMPLVSLYLLWHGLRQGNIQLRPSWGWLFCAAIVMALMTLTYIAQIAPLYRLLFAIALMLLVNGLYKTTIASLMPILMVFFVVPIWGILTVPLQQLSIYAVSGIMALTGVPTFVENTHVSIPPGTFEIAGGCSGLRYFIVSCLIGLLYSYLNLSRWRSVTLFMTVAILGALVTNWLRIVGLIVIGYVSDMKSPLMDDHNLFGWYLYIPFLAGLLLFGRYLARKDKQHTPVTSVRSTVNSQWHPLQAICLMGATLILSTQSVSLLLPSSSEQAPALPNRIAVSPIIPDPDHLSTKQGNRYPGSLHLRYAFSGLRPGNKASYYLNQPVPPDWHVRQRQLKGHYQWTLVSRSAREHAIIGYSYGAGQKQFARESQLKLERLKQAITLSRSSHLDWYYFPCPTLSECQSLFDSLTEEGSPLLGQSQLQTAKMATQH
ncbi:hypothetical protein HMF8227_01186 [Saliniradius amylolyticus]|uniref:Methanolan biosynthesis EpsI domain-containing protein n=1 Tax=Saliniradius amylolyticus TaxID=2183582 RepID=A0A2S2E3R8_9ALTE|nr:exosortase [Saliniradius amylolyticus]AWL11667.1 hypothetical protein HMF8227_01186 [Saliniradius amylolyticus]